jgi:hypothetical protein
LRSHPGGRLRKVFYAEVEIMGNLHCGWSSNLSFTDHLDAFFCGDGRAFVNEWVRFWSGEDIPARNNMLKKNKAT